jgi:carbamoyltransferase
MVILGLGFGHDGSACIIKDGKLVSAIETERLTREKHAWGVTHEVIDYVLEEANVSFDDIDCISIFDFWFPEYANDTLIFPNSIQNLTNVSTTQGVLRNKTFDVYIIPHHLSHCASAYYTSNFQEAWCFSMDSSGHAPFFNSLVARGNGNKLNMEYCPGIMVGYHYNYFTMQSLGDSVNKAGSLMGLSSYGTPHPHVVENINELVKKSFSTDHSYLKTCEELWEFVTGSYEAWTPQSTDSKKGQNMAASIQYIFEESILHCVNSIPNDTVNNLCLAGGSLLNCNVNTLIKTKTRFNQHHHFPACGDSGNAIGAALYTAHHIFNEPRSYYSEREVCYLGKTRNLEQEPDYETIAKMISEGAIVAWFMGKSEIGPRALGHRSILADARNFHMRELINFVIKKREWFRPFAPMVLEEECNKWFDFEGASPYMLYTAQVKQPNLIPSVTHIDNTARMQTINANTNPEIYKLIKEFEKITGVPIIINTSLNGPGEPILESEEDAMNFFNNVPVDAIVINGRLILRD